MSQEPNWLRIRKFLDFSKGRETKVYSVKSVMTWIGDLDIDLDPENDQLILGDRKVFVEYHLGMYRGHEDEKGYSIGFLVMGISALLRGESRTPRLVCSFPTSMYYAMEVIEKAKNARKEIYDYIATLPPEIAEASDDWDIQRLI